jgi:hypothetical protein
METSFVKVYFARNIFNLTQSGHALVLIQAVRITGKVSINLLIDSP